MLQRCWGLMSWVALQRQKLHEYLPIWEQKSSKKFKAIVSAPLIIREQFISPKISVMSSLRDYQSKTKRCGSWRGERKKKACSLLYSYIRHSVDKGVKNKHSLRSLFCCMVPPGVPMRHSESEMLSSMGNWLGCVTLGNCSFSSGFQRRSKTFKVMEKFRGWSAN